MLERVGGRISEMSEPDRCCGFGGLFSVRMPEVSNAMTAQKLHQACEGDGHVSHVRSRLFNANAGTRGRKFNKG